MPKARLTIDSGRELELEQLFIREALLNALAGKPQALRTCVLDGLPETIERIMGEHQASLILTPKGERLPRFLLMADLSSTPVQPDEDADSSRLVVCWFDDGVEAPVLELVHRAVRSVDWDRHAANCMV